MNQPNILTFSIVLGTVFVILDLVVLFRFQVFARKHKFHRYWSRGAWILAAIALVTYLFVASRRHLFRMDGLDLHLFMAVCFWYLPKLPIALAIGIYHLVGLVGRVFTKVRGTKPLDAQEPEIPSRRALLQKAAWSTAILPYGMVANGMARTLYDFTVFKEEVVLPGLPRAMDGYTIVQISDIHAGSFPDHEPFQEVVRLVMATQPDAVVITGDFVNAQPDEMGTVARDLARLASKYPVYASLGNHDHYNTPAEHRKLVEGIRELGVDLIVNAHRRIGKGAEGFVLASIDNIGFKQHYGDLGKALEGVFPDEPTILLAHDPTYWDAAIVGKAPIDLMLSGHTHGGQIAFGMLGFEVSPASLVYEQVAGMYRKGDQLLYVNRGIGTVGPPLRIGVPPEITVLTLRAPSASENFAHQRGMKSI
ncbi:MAG: metallophosphoesterase [Bradyrhizobiaceae bacterium]|nr:metallophosphoesterase [Bradyrhizobiaceae bacterium]